MYVLTRSFHTVPVVILFSAHPFSTGTSTDRLHLYGTAILPHRISRIVRLRSTTMCGHGSTRIHMGPWGCVPLNFINGSKCEQSSIVHSSHATWRINDVAQTITLPNLMNLFYRGSWEICRFTDVGCGHSEYMMAHNMIQSHTGKFSFSFSCVWDMY